MVEERVKEEKWDEEAIFRITNENIIWLSTETASIIRRMKMIFGA